MYNAQLRAYGKNSLQEPETYRSWWYVNCWLISTKTFVLVLIAMILVFLAESCQADPGFNPWQGQEIFLCSRTSRLTVGLTESPIQWVLAVLSPGLEQLRLAEVNSAWSYTCNPSVCLHDMDRDNIFYLPVWNVSLVVPSRKSSV